MTISAVNSELDSYLKSLQQRNEGKSLLLSHASSSPSLRMAITTPIPEAEAAVYRRANIAAPAERALQEWHATENWMERIVQLQKGKLLYLQTLPRDAIASRLQEQQQKEMSSTMLQIIQLAATNPFGWNEDEENKEETDSMPNLQNLSQLLEYIVKQVENNESSENEKSNTDNKTREEEKSSENEIKTTTDNTTTNTILIFQSLTPLILRHGTRKTLLFLQQLQQQLPIALLILPVDRCSISSHIHRQLLQHYSDALLYITNGNVEWLRKGLRDSTKYVRSSSVKDSGMETKEEQTTTATILQQSNDSSTAIQKNRKKIELKLEEDDAKKQTTATTKQTSAAQPRIYLQDNDPEFEDYDEEDPDDDLEI